MSLLSPFVRLPLQEIIGDLFRRDNRLLRELQIFTLPVIQNPSDSITFLRAFPLIHIFARCLPLFCPDEQREARGRKASSEEKGDRQTIIIQYYSAVRNSPDCIITCNKKDFSKAKIPVLNPEEFLAMFVES